MDPITLSIVTSLLGNLGYDAIKKAYSELKGRLERKYGPQSDIVETVNKLEQKPESKARQNLLQEEVANAKANRDQKLLKVANDLLKKLNELPDANININQQIKIKGDRNIVTGKGDVTITE